MSGSRRVALNTLSLFSAEMLNPLASMLLIAMIGRNYGKAGFGQYSLVLTYYFTAVMLASLGLTTPVTRAVAARKERASDFMIVGSTVGLAAAVVAFVAISLVVRLLDYPTEVQSASAVMMWSVFPTAITTFSEAIFLAFEKAKYVAILSVTENLLKVALGSFAIWMGRGIVFLFGLLLILRIVACVANLIILRIAVCRLTLRFDLSVLKELALVTPVFSINLLLTVLFGRIDVILLSKLAGLEAVGLYSLAQRVVSLLLMLAVSFKRAIFPPLCARCSDSQQDAKRVYQMSVKYMGVLGGLAVLGVAQWGEVVLRVLGGKNLMDAHTGLLILSVALIPGFVFPVCAALLVAVNKQALDLVTSAIRLGLLVALTFVLVGRFEDRGAAMAFSTASVVFLVLQTLCVNKAVFPAEHIKVLWRPTVASVVLSLAFVPLGWIIPWWISGPISFAVYSVTLLLLGTFPPSERKALFGMIEGMIASGGNVLRRRDIPAEENV